MKPSRKFLVAILAANLVLPVWAIMSPIPQDPSQAEKITEITPLEIESGMYRHIGDVALSNRPGTSEEVIEEARRLALDKGAGYYQVTRLQMMENNSWSINLALYSESEITVN